MKLIDLQAQPKVPGVVLDPNEKVAVRCHKKHWVQPGHIQLENRDGVVHIFAINSFGWPIHYVVNPKTGRIEGVA